MSIPNVFTGIKTLNAFETHILKDNHVLMCGHMCVGIHIYLLCVYRLYLYTVLYVVVICSEEAKLIQPNIFSVQRDRG